MLSASAGFGRLSSCTDAYLNHCLLGSPDGVLPAAQFHAPCPELGQWVRKQRIAKEQGTLSPERLRMLLELGFEFGEEAQLTEDWEWRFDLLLELLCMRVGFRPSGASQTPCSSAQYCRLLGWLLCM